jgi:predicted amidophosphoribosyltransferase
VTPPTPPARTVDEVVRPYGNFLVPVPGRGAPDTCATCHSVVYDGWPRCFPCQEAVQTLGTGIADVTAFVSMAPADEQFARELYTYKRLTVPAHLRQQRMVGLAAVLWKWLSLHEACVAAALRIRSFDIVTSVPSGSGRLGDHPLRQLVAGVVTGTADRYADLLTLSRADLDQRVQAADRFRATRDLTGRRVLVIDDTWTTGAHAQSASCAIKAAGGRQRRRRRHRALVRQELASQR